jgi:hypothetical protein
MPDDGVLGDTASNYGSTYVSTTDCSATLSAPSATPDAVSLAYASGY